MCLVGHSWSQKVPDWGSVISAKTRMAKELISDFRMTFLTSLVRDFEPISWADDGLDMYKMLLILPNQHLYFWSLSLAVRGQRESRKSLHRQATTVPGTFQAYCWYRQLIANDSQDLGPPSNSSYLKLIIPILSPLNCV